MDATVATLVSGCISALGTLASVYFTNRWTSDRYKKDKESYNKKEKFVIIKPSLRNTCFYNIIDEIIMYNIRDRVLLLSTGNEGFAFYDDDSKRFENHRIISIKNDSCNSIKSVLISVSSAIITSSQATLKDEYTNYVQHLRRNEEILFRVHNTEQRKKLWEELDSKRHVITTFYCKITYFTEADEQICYEYKIKIDSEPQEKEINQKLYTTECARIEVEKDEYYILEKQRIVKDKKASYFRNIQDNIILDRTFYLHKKIGEAQAQGIMQQTHMMNISQSNSNNVEKSTKETSHSQNT